MRRVFLVFATCSLVSSPRWALAEGSVDIGVGQGLDQGNFDATPNADEILVDVLDGAERIRICASDDGGTRGRDLNEVILRSPSGIAYDLDIDASKGFCDEVSDLAGANHFVLPADLPGAVAALEVGVWTVDFAGQDEDFLPDVNGQNTRFWDVTVLTAGGVPVAGSRVHSSYWQLTSHGFYVNPASSSYYVYVPSGANGDYTFRIDLQGVSGFRYQVFANRVGIQAFPSRSHVTGLGVFASPEYELYLGIPSIATGPTLEPHIFDQGDGGGHVLPHFETAAGSNALNDVQTDGDFVFEANTPGTYQVVVDTNQDGIFDSAVDRLIVGDAIAGVNRAPWDGLDAAGQPLPHGIYSARIQFIVAETHFPIGDIEYASCQFALDGNHTCSVDGAGNCGIRIWGVDPLGADDSVPIDNFYNDLDVDDDGATDGATTLPGGDPAGTLRLPAAGACDPLFESAPHEWYDWEACLGGLFEGTPCQSDLDCPLSTCDWVGLGDGTIMDTWAFGAVDGEVAIVIVGCEFDVADTDADGIIDCTEGEMGTDPQLFDTDQDGLGDGRELDIGTDPLDSDTDGDFLTDGIEVDGVNATDPLDEDSDDDGLRDGSEDRDRDGSLDADEPDPNDGDSDDDGVIDGDEPDWNVDSDGDGAPNARDTDSDDDGLLDGTELGVTEPAPDTDVAAGGFVADADPATRTDPTNPDTDAGSVADGLEDTDRNGRIDPGERDPNDPTDDVPLEDAGPDAAADDAGVDAGPPDSGPPIDPGFRDYTIAGGCACTTSAGAGRPDLACAAILAISMVMFSRRRRR